MKTIFSLVAVAALLGFSSCEKNNADIIEPPQQVKKIIESTLDENWSFTYNQNGSIKEMAIPAADYKVVYSYSAGKTEADYYSDGNLSAKAIYSLENGKPVKYIYTHFDGNGQVKYINEETFQYNAKGLLSKRTFDYGDYEIFEYDATENLVLRSYFTGGGTQINKIEYTYGNQKDKFPQFSYLSTNLPGFIFPAFSKNLPVSEKRTSLPGNTVTYHISLTYELDADGFVTKGKLHSLLPVSSDYEWINIFQ